MSKEKNIKDYLHLYLGCEVLINDTPHTGTLTTISILGTKQRFRVLIGAASVERYFDLEKDKPILRPLSDMTEEEMYEAVNIGKLMYAGGGVKGFIQGWSAFSGENFIYLLSKSFDLFNLIESGLAINATTLKNKST